MWARVSNFFSNYVQRMKNTLSDQWINGKDLQDRLILARSITGRGVPGRRYWSAFNELLCDNLTSLPTEIAHVHDAALLIKPPVFQRLSSRPTYFVSEVVRCNNSDCGDSDSALRIPTTSKERISSSCSTGAHLSGVSSSLRTIENRCVPDRIIHKYMPSIFQMQTCCYIIVIIFDISIK